MKERLWTNIVLLGFSVWLFLFAVSLLSFSAKGLGSGFAEQLFEATSNPFISLFIGLLSSAIIQSSSTVTSMTVALVGAGTLSFSSAIPIIMGANIGTCLTSTLVALAHITSRSQFRRAFATGTTHDLFNLLGTAVLFPLEIYFGILSTPAKWIAGLIDLGTKRIPGLSDISPGRFEKISEFVTYLFGNFTWIPLILAVILIFLSIRWMAILIRVLFVKDSQRQFEENFFGNKRKAFGWGVFSTAMVQSSSLTTSLTVPLVATGKVAYGKAVPFIIGANIGTTLTALIASLQQSIEAREIAFVHLIFNIMCALLFVPGTPLGKLHSFLSLKLGDMVYRERLLGFVYVIVVFFLLPFLLIFLSGGMEFNR